ncbi:hypothetical protein OUZ56_012081 [Daphnia magna]|uniref:Uncharacterized protein n=1 Tax=Daphnia magna TaxID=35525 RepID=A0ABQ9Z258_9CRUS|nr:hypothetical protein OUZ56_012081 [Daphnia magna]
MFQFLMKHIRSTYIIQTPASPVRTDFMPTQHWGNDTSMASKTAAATSSRKEADHHSVPARMELKWLYPNASF